MNRTWIIGIWFLAGVPLAAAQGEVPALRFRPQEIETGLKVGYAVLPADVNGDNKPDLVIVDTTRVVWYENPTWKRRVVVEGRTKPDNVCIAAADIDRDGHLDFALGADWNPSRTREGGTLQWLRRGKTLDDPWDVFPIGTEPTVHRIRFADLDGDGTPELVVVPLMGRGATAKANWMDGEPVRLLAFRIPKDPVRDRWMPEVVDQSLHVVHGFSSVPATGRKGHDVLTASYEGVSLLFKKAERWDRRLIGAGNQDQPDKSRGASEVKQGRLKSGRPFVATIEPWHGHQVIVYVPPAEGSAGLWERHLLDDQLRWGHAVWCADLDGDGSDELVVGVRDTLGDQPGKRRGVRVYRPLDAAGAKWSRQVVEDGGVATEDLAAADLDTDGRTDLIAVGRQTGNARIYWNLCGK